MDKQELDRIIARVDESLNKENQIRFRAMDREMQEKVVWDMMDHGIANFKVGH